MSSRRHPARQKGSEGFALVLAILALLLLTFLGLTLAVTTTTELQIATNYKWSEQARANAEAGIEAGKRVLRDLDWSQILPGVRVGTWNAPVTSTVPGKPSQTTTANTRDFENLGCDTTGGEGYGIVLTDGTNVYQNISRVPSFPASTTLTGGTFTLWVRRPVVRNVDGTYSDYNVANSPALILTSEGSAPFAPITPGGPQASFQAVNRAVYVMEVYLSQSPLPPCGSRAGQTGSGQAGSGFAACATLGDDAVTRELQQIGTDNAAASYTGQASGGGTGGQTAGGVNK